MTLVSVDALKNATQDEGARTTVTQSVGSYNIINNLPGLPPIVATGSVDIYGTLQIVANPNAGGTGLPESVWSTSQSTGHGTADTCYATEFFAGGSVA